MGQLKNFLVELYDIADDLSTTPGMHGEDVLVYAVEAVVEREVGVRRLSQHEVESFVHDVCTVNDINTPDVVVRPSSSPIVGRASVDEHLLCLSRRNSSVFTVLHEVAHFMAPHDRHGTRFRNAFVRLVREHVSVEHASLAYTLFCGIDLDMAPWETLHRASS